MKPLLTGTRAAAAAALVLALPACSLVGSTSEATPPAPTGSISVPEPTAEQLGGQVTNEAGDPVFGARVDLDGSGAVSDADGRFVIARPTEDGLLTVTADGAYGFTPVDAQGDDELHVTVHPAPGTSRTLRFGGEVRTGRSLLPREAVVTDYARALEGVAPLLGIAESSAVTLASPLVRDPWRAQVDASSSQLAPALAQSGVDVVNLATDRAADAGRDGVRTTLRALDDAGLRATGAGRNLATAWLPAVVTVDDQEIAYVGCQMGATDAPWAATDDLPGAAPCDVPRMRQEITRAARGADSVVVFIRGDRPYETEVWPAFSRRVMTAVRAGATVIVGGGSHVSGEVWDFGDATATQSLGDLLTDDLSWPTRNGILLRTDVEGDQATSVSAEPLTRNAGIPSMVKGDLAEEISRVAAADTNDGPLVLADDMAVVSAGTWTIDQTTVPARVDEEGAPLELGDSWWLPPAGQPGVMAGYDLVPTGTFEDVDADAATDGALGWFLSPGSELVRAGEGDTDLVCEGELAVAMRPQDGRPASLFSSGRIPLPTTAGVSVSVAVRDLGPEELRGRLSLQWFDGETKVGEDSVPLEALDSSCDGLRLDTVPPADADSLRPVLVVRGGAAAVDDLHVVAWIPGQNGGRRYTRIRVFEPVQVTLVVDVPRGAEAPPGPFRGSPDPS